MRDRTLPMKWVEDAAVSCGGDASQVIVLLEKRGVNKQTITDQMRRLRKHGFVASVPDHASSDVVVDVSSTAVEKPFLPAPKTGLKKKK